MSIERPRPPIGKRSAKFFSHSLEDVEDEFNRLEDIIHVKHKGERMTEYKCGRCGYHWLGGGLVRCRECNTFDLVQKNNKYKRECFKCGHEWVGRDSPFASDYCAECGDPYLRQETPKTPVIKPTDQSFESIIMECQDTLSIEVEVENKYNEWLGKRKEPKEPQYKKWLGNPEKSKLKFSFNFNGFNLAEYSILFCLCSFLSAMIFYYGDSVSYWIASALFLSICVLLLSLFFYSCVRIKLYKPAPKKEPPEPREAPKSSESSKLEFLKEYYSGTMSVLYSKLELIQKKIQEQITVHRKDKEEVKEVGDILGNTEEIIEKISAAISRLMKASSKLSDKKSEIQKTINEYIGEDGYISKKEKEIERLEIAQKLSDRMKKNFNTTLEIEKDIDVLTDVVLPGIKQLISLKIPEIIKEINFEVDKKEAFLEISR